jgi:hypothetical protein
VFLIGGSHSEYNFLGAADLFGGAAQTVHSHQWLADFLQQSAEYHRSELGWGQ